MTQKSSDHLLESLSALVDGEASELELRRILKTLSEDDDVQAKWGRYNLIGQVMRKEGATAESLDLSASVRGALAGDQSFDVDLNKKDQVEAEVETASNQEWKSWLGKTSVAASVAAAFVFGFGQLNGGLSSIEEGVGVTAVASMNSAANSGQAVQANNSTITAPLGFELPALESRTVSTAQMQSRSGNSASSILMRSPVTGEGFSDLQSQALLNQLHIQHAQRASLNGGMGILPFARISTMEELAPE